MAYIFLDESGDLGFDRRKARSSKYFVITLLLCEDKRPIEKIVKTTHASLKKLHKQKGGVLHCYREKPVTRNRLLSKLADKDVKVMTITLIRRRSTHSFRTKRTSCTTLSPTSFSIGS